MQLTDEIEQIIAEKSQVYRAIKEVLRNTYFKGFTDEKLEAPELQRDIEDHTFRRYEKTLTYYIPWIARVFDLSDKELIEVGCGTGSSTAAFASFVKQIYAYEVSEISVSAARGRMQAMGFNNVSILHSEPENLLETLKSNHQNGVSIILLFAVLEHMTVQERLSTLKDLWDLLLPGGILVVAETPNRLTYFDYHTSRLPFFHFLPLDLAIEYYEKSPREQFRLSMDHHRKNETLADVKTALIRWGNAISYHEFEVVLGSNLKDLLIADGDAEEMRFLYPPTMEEKLLKKYFLAKEIEQPLAFTNRILNLIFQKAAV